MFTLSYFSLFSLLIQSKPRSTLFPYTTLFRSAMLGYLNAENPFTEDGWFKTGDAVEVNGEYIKILGRASPVLNRSEEHTSELQSLTNLVCRLLLEKKKRYSTFR